MTPPPRHWRSYGDDPLPPAWKRSAGPSRPMLCPPRACQAPAVVPRARGLVCRPKIRFDRDQAAAGELLSSGQPDRGWAVPPATYPADIAEKANRRKLTVVMHADMVGYSRLIGLDDSGTFLRLRRCGGR